MNLTRFTLDVTSVNPFTLYDMVKAKRIYIKKFHECAICGSQKYLECHHVKPVHLFPELACDADNFITLCDPRNNGCHKWFGHYGNFRSKWNPDIKSLAYNIRLFYKAVNSNFQFAVELDPSFQLHYFEYQPQ